MPTRYIVHGTDKDSQTVKKIFEAETSQEAERIAGRLGISVVGVEVDPSSIAAAAPAAAVQEARDARDFPDDARAARRLGPEAELWKGTTSQWVNFWWVLLCLVSIPVVLVIYYKVPVLQTPYVFLLLVFPFGWVLWRWMLIKTSRFTLTSQRLRFEKGVLTRTIDEVELYRVKDTQLHQTIPDRALNIGTIEVLSSDETNPTLYLPKIPRPREVREQLRTCVERLRLARGVRELDLSMDNDPNVHPGGA